MFHRKRASSSHSIQSRHVPPNVPTAPAAQAATLAFSNSTASLSSSAAAAALRSHQTSPTPVSDVQTTRTQRRGSTASTRSGAASHVPGLQRRGSAGSMTARSFRSPSPGAGRHSVEAARDAPPVPAVPAGAAQFPRTDSFNRRATSVESAARVHSPPPVKRGGRGVSLDRSYHNIAPSPVAGGMSSLTNASELDHEDSKRASVNFSRPMSPQLDSSTQTIPFKNAGWHTAPIHPGEQDLARRTTTPRQLPSTSAEAASIQQGMVNVAIGQGKKKKKRRAMGSEGSHPSIGISKLTGTAVEERARASQSTANTSKFSGDAVHTGSLQGSHFATHSVKSAPSLGASSSSNPEEIFKDDGKKSSSQSSLPLILGRPQSWNTQAGRLLSKQPSIVHERPEAEEQEEKFASANTGRKVDSAKSEDVLRARSNTVDSDRSHSKHLDVGGPERQQSPSPSRSTRFSAAPTELANGIKHQPLGRAVSPFKSALKHSPSSSIRAISPEARHAITHSRNTSDTADVSLRSKKATRVSFDDVPVLASPGLESSKFAIPPNDAVRGLSQSDFEDILMPRPALPAFGSVRGRKDIEETRHLPRSSGRGRTPSPLSSSQSTLFGTERSNDHALGGLLAQDLKTKKDYDSDRPAALAPEVTSVEGTGYVSDSDSTFSSNVNATDHSIPEEHASDIAAKGAIPDEVVSNLPERPAELTLLPSLAIIPPTPAAVEARDFSIPGAFPSVTDDETEGAIAHKSETPIQNIQKISESKTGGVPLTAAALLQNSLARDDNSSDSDTSSIYSDASEDPNDMYATFASLDAIVESPVPETNQSPAIFSSSKSPLTLDKTEDASPSPTSAQWDKTTAYWRSLSDVRKQEYEQRASAAGTPLSDSQMLQPSVGPTTTVKAKPKSKPARTTSTEQAAVVAPTSTSQTTKKSAQTKMKHTLRSSADEPDEPETVHMRSSLRSGGSMQTTMRGQTAGLNASRWNNSPESNEPKSAFQKKRNSKATSSPLAAAPTPAPSKAAISMIPSLQRADSADSASSFKKRRPKASNSGGKITLRRSMRDPSPVQAPVRPPAVTKQSRLSIRSLSPAGSTANHHMRSSLRQSIDSNTPSMRTPEKKKSRMTSPSRFSLGKSTKSKEVVAPPPPSKFRSRFAHDSDDEDGDDVPRTSFVSRFVDSDDEIDGPSSPTLRSDLTPVRGIPRRAGDADRDSTDLEDESADERPTIPAVPSAKDVESAHATPMSSNAQGAALASGSLRETSSGGLAASKHAPRPDMSKKRFSFLGKGKKRSSSVPVSSSQPESKTGTSDLTRPPRLQRKTTTTGTSTLARVPEDSWPLPLPPAIGGEHHDRNSSDSLPLPRANVSRPDVGKRRSTADTFGLSGRRVSFSNNEPIYSAKTGRKKKFPRLRKMFGLND